MTSRPSTLRALARIFRFEYLYATFPGLSITLFLCGRSPGDLLHRAPVEGLVIVAMMVFACLGMNAIVDRDIDRKYATEKSRIAEALDVVGPGKVWVIILLQNVIALALTIDLCRQFDSVFPLALVLAEALFAYGYSVPPLQFKLRGVLAHALSLSLATGGITFVLSAYTYLGTVPFYLAVFILGFATVQYGFEFANQALDYREDKLAGLRTPAVRLGVVASLRASLLVPIVGMGILAFSLLRLFFERAAESSAARGDGEVWAAWGTSLVPLVAGYALPMVRTWQMLRLCRNGPPEDCVPQFPDYCHYATWQASSVAGTAASAAVYFVWRVYVW